MDEQQLDKAFAAMADPTRRDMIARLTVGDAAVGELAANYDMSMQAVSKHLAILEEANLVATVKRGREKLHYLNPVPIAEIANRWIRKFERQRVDALVDLKKRLESE